MESRVKTGKTVIFPGKSGAKVIEEKPLGVGSDPPLLYRKG